MKYCVIADEATVKGFSLFKVEGVAVKDAIEAQQAFEKAVQDKSLGAIILSVQVADSLRPLVDAHKKSGNFPQIIGL